ncbi:unnamed protein product [Phyllotreta striolata]|uniref:Major facilitator superfamily (MFS) profile domain-containing protein n=1 Tax=Phyllotreta striolata TaxID=444603 RepID=A0A9N9XT38_PHYSR|nr:unnamed protein product [Phyllotreta striolata]
MHAAKFCKDDRESCDFDRAIDLTGNGKFHYELKLVCCLSSLSVGFQNGLSSYIFGPARCELGITSGELGLLNVAFLVGGIGSCFVWGILADNRGRKKILIFTHLLNAVINVLCSIVPYKNVLTLCRFFSGFLIGAPGTLTYTYIVEFHQQRKQFRNVCLCGIFFVLSWLLLPILAYAILPLEFSYNAKNVVALSPWRLFLLVLTAPDVLVGFWLMRLPESPKFWLAKGQQKKALAILQRMYAANKGVPRDGFPVKHIVGEGGANVKGNEIMVTGKTLRVLKELLQQIQKLFQKPLVIKTGLTTGLMFSNMFGLFGLGIWLPELFIKFNQYQSLHPNSTVTVKELSTLNLERNQTCEHSIDQNVVINTVATGSCALIFNIICCLLASKVSSKRITLVLSFVGGLSAGSIYWLQTATQNLIVACIFQSTTLTANLTATSVVVEAFPASVGGIAICLAVCVGRFGAVFSSAAFAYFMDNHCEIPIFMVAFFGVLASLLCMMLPNQEKRVECDRGELEQRHFGFFTRKQSYEIATISHKIVDSNCIYRQ